MREALSQRDRPQGHRRQDHGRRRRAGRRLPALAGVRHRRRHAARQVRSAEAKKLLAEAGYPNGFSITLGTPNGRYINDLKVAQAIAAMWSRIGVKTEVEATAPPVFFKNRDEFKYSAYLAGWGSDSGEMSNPLRSLVATPSREKGMGGTNRGRYSNPAMDAKLEEAMRTVDDKKREALLQEASKLVIADYGVLPLHFELSVWAMRKGLTYAAAPTRRHWPSS